MRRRLLIFLTNLKKFFKLILLVNQLLLVRMVNQLF